MTREFDKLSEQERWELLRQLVEEIKPKALKVPEAGSFHQNDETPELDCGIQEPAVGTHKTEPLQIVSVADEIEMYANKLKTETNPAEIQSYVRWIRSFCRQIEFSNKLYRVCSSFLNGDGMRCGVIDEAYNVVRIYRIRQDLTAIAEKYGIEDMNELSAICANS